MMEYRLVRSRRKTIAITFDENARLVVKAPYWLDDERIRGFVEAKGEWIKATQTRLLAVRQKNFQGRPKLETGDRLPYLGGEKVLTVVRDARARVKVVKAGDRIIMWIPYEADYELRRMHLERWYRSEAAYIFDKRAAKYARIIGVTYHQIHIKDQKSRWGSCSGKGNLNFNWRLVMAPGEVLDYVVIHELCHLVHMNHSPEFWELVERSCPSYAKQKRWLKANGETLYII